MLEGHWIIGGIRILKFQAIVIVAAIVLMFALYSFVMKSRIGKWTMMFRVFMVLPFFYVSTLEVLVLRLVGRDHAQPIQGGPGGHAAGDPGHVPGAVVAAEAGDLGQHQLELLE